MTPFDIILSVVADFSLVEWAVALACCGIILALLVGEGG